ncbi:putative Glutathione S-transferase [Arthroderma uncinatum]|uniref:putative Glutathione S-transferase n=1 Tax=Arthroderma uncinatum TaxID=74035 RepID=UPI00144AAF02|nr:putative Glutathione S-transferase [Arthroderma uncinatum]KAF3491044.1 putative Glutathione S-transferase [Arthroderma uncinatum]
MGLKLYGFSHSTNTQRVVLVLNELKVPFEYISVDLSKGEHKNEDYMKIQPFGCVPCIDDDGFVLYESRAICHYIVTKYASQGTPLVPSELKANALYAQGLSLEVGSFDAAAAPLVYEKLFKPYQGKTPDEHSVKLFESNLLQCLDGYEKILSKQKYIGGNELTLADLYHLPYLTLLPQVGCNAVDERPSVSRWAKEILARPTWKSLMEDGVKGSA